MRGAPSLEPRWSRAVSERCSAPASAVCSPGGSGLSRNGSRSHSGSRITGCRRERGYTSRMIPAQEALARLREGNRRFVASGAGPAGRPGSAQQPFAIVLGCSDSRVPAELVFGQGFGDLFVIRVAGNIVAPSQVGSVEFAAARFGTRLAVVLGHTQCGAVRATLEEVRQPAPRQSPNLRSIVDRIRPSVEPLLAATVGLEPEVLLAHAVR